MGALRLCIASFNDQLRHRSKGLQLPYDFQAVTLSQVSCVKCMRQLWDISVNSFPSCRIEMACIWKWRLTSDPTLLMHGYLGGQSWEESIAKILMKRLSVPEAYHGRYCCFKSAYRTIRNRNMSHMKRHGVMGTCIKLLSNLICLSHSNAKQ